MLAAATFWWLHARAQPYAWIEIDGVSRAYLLYAPPPTEDGAPAPLVIALHGFLGTPKTIRERSALDTLAATAGFFVLYPKGQWWRWRMSPKHEADLVDLRFIETLLDKVLSAHPIDEGRIYITGLSGGAMMTHLIACALGERVAAAASVVGTITPEAAAYAAQFGDAVPVPMMMVHGSADNTVRWEGDTTKWYGQPAYMSVPDTLAFWRERNKTKDTPTRRTLPDNKPDDVTAVTEERYPPGVGGAEVILYTVQGGEHSWPGSNPELYAKDVKVCRHFNATHAIWSFFKKHSR